MPSELPLNDTLSRSEKRFLLLQLQEQTAQLEAVHLAIFTSLRNANQFTASQRWMARKYAIFASLKMLINKLVMDVET